MRLYVQAGVSAYVIARVNERARPCARRGASEGPADFVQRRRGGVGPVPAPLARPRACARALR
eukprot:11105266-Lingulodinium_polyedra.AAC.1